MKVLKKKTRNLVLMMTIFLTLTKINLQQRSMRKTMRSATNPISRDFWSSSKDD